MSDHTILVILLLYFFVREALGLISFYFAGEDDE